MQTHSQVIKCAGGRKFLMPKKIRVWIADCHCLVGTGLQTMLEQDAGIEVVEVSGQNRQCADRYRQSKADVAIMDMTLKGTCCLDAMRHILAHDPDARILVISAQADCITVNRIRKAGAKGYISIESTAETLIEAVRTLARGRVYIDPLIAQQLAWDHPDSLSPDSEGNPFDMLTGREFEIFLMLVGDHSLNEIAASLNLSRSTVANHHTHILHKLGTPNHISLTKLAIRHGIVKA